MSYYNFLKNVNFIIFIFMYFNNLKSLIMFHDIDFNHFQRLDFGLELFGRPLFALPDFCATPPLPE